jgi:hypothetical protein
MCVCVPGSVGMCTRVRVVLLIPACDSYAPYCDVIHQTRLVAQEDFIKTSHYITILYTCTLSNCDANQYVW